MKVRLSERTEETKKVPAKGRIPLLIEELVATLAPLEGGFSPIVERLIRLRSRVEEDRFQLAVLGQFKRGKSTLLNALLGEEILPTSVLPLTAIPTHISWGKRRKATVFFQDGHPPAYMEADDPTAIKDFLAHYVTERENPENRRGVSHVEVTHPAPILARGVVLIDTPGIGSTFRHNTSTTLSFLPQCDAALFVTSPDPPLTEVEAEFLESVQAHAARLFVVLNKIDHLDPTERREALQFLSAALAEKLDGTAPPPIFPASARHGLQAQLSGDRTGWAESGMSVLERHLTDFLIRDKALTLALAAAGKVTALIDEAALQLDLSIRSLSLPLSTLEEKMDSFQRTIADVKRERQIAADLLAGERLRLLDFLETQAEELRRAGQKHLSDILDDALRETTDENALRGKVAAAIPGFFASQCDALAKRFITRVSEALHPHQERAEALLERLRRSAAELFEIPYQPAQDLGEFRLVQRPYWVTQTYSTSFIPNPARLVDRFVPARVRMERIRTRLSDEIETLVLHNVENLRVTTRESLERTLREFKSRLNARFDETLAATQGAIAAAKRKRAEADSVVEEIDRLRRIKDRVLGVKARLGKEMR